MTTNTMRLTMAIRMTGTHDLVADQRLAQRIVGGDDEAFEDLVRRHFKQVARIAGRFFRRPEIAEEVVQEVFVKAFTAMATYRAEMPLEHWLSRIAVNACYDQLRRSKRRPESSVSEIAEDPAEFFDRLRAPGGTATAAFWEKEEARLCAEELLSMLAPAERVVLTMMVLEDMTAAEVATNVPSS